MSVAARIAKLCRMADHPTSNPHEAEIARREIERLKHDHPRATPEQIVAGRFVFNEALQELYQNAECGICHIALNLGWAESISYKRCPRHIKILAPGDANYYEWARGLRVGEVVGIGWSHGAKEPSTLVLTIARLTVSQYVMDDGSRFRRAGRFPGYRVGEDGRNGRTYLVASEGR